jgi:hypothetical protein
MTAYQVRDLAAAQRSGSRMFVSCLTNTQTNITYKQTNLCDNQNGQFCPIPKRGKQHGIQHTVNAQGRQQHKPHSRHNQAQSVIQAACEI